MTSGLYFLEGILLVKDVTIRNAVGVVVGVCVID